MDILEQQKGPVSIVSVSGNIDTLTAGDLIRFFSDRIQAGKKWIVVDLSQVDFMSSAGLRVFLGALKESRQQGGDVYIAAAQPGVENVLNISGFTKIMKVFPDVEEALAGFKEGNVE